MTEDYEAWAEYPHHHNWFNKLFVAEQLRYNCGPCGFAPSQSDYYIIRPIYNLGGMGVGTSLEFIEAGDYSKVPPGYFWCEVLLGKQYSATYQFVHDTNPYWKPISCWEGEKHPGSFSKFTKWTRSSYAPTVPRIFNVLSDVKRINVEFKGDAPFEVHLRSSPDPDYNELIPVWQGEEHTVDELKSKGYSFIPSRDDSNGFLKQARVGFMVK